MLTGTYNVSNGSLTVVVDDQPILVDRYHPVYAKLLEAWKNQDEKTFLNLYNNPVTNTQEEIVEYASESGIEVTNGEVYYNGVKLHNSLVDRILYNKRHGFPVDNVVKFLENLMENPSSRSVEEAPDFLSHRNMPITEDGCFLAYKSVSSDFYSKARGSLNLVKGKTVDGRIYNGVGEVIECPRNQVDDERRNECSHGLHVGALAYAGPGGYYNSYNDKVVIVKVNPRDVVSVPKDHQAQKLRVCRYEVVKEFVKPLPSSGVGDRNIQSQTVSVRNIDVYDSIKFDYQGSNDVSPKRRHAFVDDVNNDTVYCTLLEDDPNYEEGNEMRNFKLNKMSNIEFVEESNIDNNFDEEYNEDNFDIDF